MFAVTMLLIVCKMIQINNEKRLITNHRGNIPTVLNPGKVSKDCWKQAVTSFTRKPIKTRCFVTFHSAEDVII